MRFKVELHRDVGQYVRRECSEFDRAAFYDMLERIRSDPITNSEVIADVSISRYTLRYFRFGRHMAVFQLDPVKDRVVVRVCRRFRDNPTRGRSAADTP